MATGVRLVTNSDIVTAYLFFHQKDVRPSKHQLCVKLSEIVGFVLDADLIPDWSAVYRGIMEMRDDIWDDWIYKVYGTYDRKEIIRLNLDPQQPFENVIAQLTEDEIAPYGMNATSYIEDTARGYIQFLKDSGQQLYEMPREEAIELIDRTKRMACLWDRHLKKWLNEGKAFISGKFARRSGYGTPTLWDIINERKRWFEWESDRIIEHMLQFLSVGGITTAQIEDKRRKFEGIEYQQKVKLTMINGPVPVSPLKCYWCEASFTNEEDRKTHMEHTHGARP